MKRFFHSVQFTFRKKIFLVTILCIVIPAFLVYTSTYQLTKKILQQEAVLNANETLEVADLYVSTLFDTMLNSLIQIQYDKEINDILIDIANQTERHTLDSDKLFSQIKFVQDKLYKISFYGDIGLITILLPDGTYFVNYTRSEYNPSEFFKESWFNTLNNFSKADTLWLGVQSNYLIHSKESNPFLLTLAKVTMSNNLKPNGYLIGSIDEKKISQFFRKYAGNQEIMLTDEHGRILSHTDPNRIGNYVPFQLKNLSQSEILHISGTDYLVVNHSLPIENWHLISISPYKKAIAKIGRIQQINLVIQVIFFSVFLVILLLLLRQFTKPLVKLARIAVQVEKGDLELRTNIQGKDEIGQLGMSFDRMLNRIQEMIAQITLEQTGKRKAELAMLQAQINPHFLFNTLNAIRLKHVMDGDGETVALINSLSSLLRMTINRNNELISLIEEVEIIGHYIRIMNFRGEHIVSFETQLSEDSKPCLLPRFIIQPLIENAIIHGFHQGEGKIILHSEIQSDGALCVRVQDNGVGMTKKQLQDTMYRLEHHHLLAQESSKNQGLSGIGLHNVYERLHMIYGSSFKMEILSTYSQGTEIILIIPQQY